MQADGFITHEQIKYSSIDKEVVTAFVNFIVNLVLCG